MQTFTHTLKTLPKSEYLFELSQSGDLDLNDVLLYIKGCASSAEPGYSCPQSRSHSRA